MSNKITEGPTGAEVTEGASEYLRNGWEPDTPSADSILLAGFRAMMNRSADWALAAGGRAVRDDDLMMADSGSGFAFFNEVITTRPCDGDVARQALRFFPPERPFVLLSPHRGEDLRPYGLTPVGHPPFMLRSPAIPAPMDELAASSGLNVTEVSDRADLTTWSSIVAAGFAASEVAAPTGLLAGRRRFFLAHYQGQPVAASSAFVGDGVIDVEAVATLPEYRRRGFGTAVSWAATLVDTRLPAVLIASDLGRPVYERMNYASLCRATMWMHAR
jgi:GNAT superfamily N-acetyltransferase